MKFVVVGLFVFAALLSVATAATLCTATKSQRPYEKWVFDESRFNHTLTSPAIEFNFGGVTIPLSVVYRFCEEVELVEGATDTNPDEHTWLGWAFGTLQEFEYVREEQLNPEGILPPKGTAEKDEEAAMAPEDVGSVRSFVQTFMKGDDGFPCRAGGRRSYVHLYCAEGPSASCLTTGAPQRNCLTNTIDPSGSPCICQITYPAEGDFGPDPCRLDIKVLIHDCPSMEVVPFNPAPAQSRGPSGGQVFGIILLVLFLMTLAVFTGGYIYNYTVNNERGVNAIPFIHLCRRNEDHVYYPAPSESSYGST